MKVKNLKHNISFTIVTIFDYFKIKKSFSDDFFFRNREFAAEYSYLKICFSKWRKFATKQITVATVPSTGYCFNDPLQNCRQLRRNLSGGAHHWRCVIKKMQKKGLIFTLFVNSAVLSVSVRSQKATTSHRQMMSFCFRSQ